MAEINGCAGDAAEEAAAMTTPDTSREELLALAKKHCLGQPGQISDFIDALVAAGFAKPDARVRAVVELYKAAELRQTARTNTAENALRDVRAELAALGANPLAALPSGEQAVRSRRAAL